MPATQIIDNTQPVIDSRDVESRIDHLIDEIGTMALDEATMTALAYAAGWLR